MMKHKALSVVCLLLAIFLMRADDKAVAIETDDHNEEAAVLPEKTDEGFDELFNRLNLDSLLDDPDQAHLPATEEMQRLVDQLENIKISDYNDNFEDHHLDFIDFESDL
jgi:hypothetical protein